MRVIYSGDRDWVDAAMVGRTMDDLLKTKNELIIVEGEARGARHYSQVRS